MVTTFHLLDHCHEVWFKFPVFCKEKRCTAILHTNWCCVLCKYITENYQAQQYTSNIVKLLHLADHVIIYLHHISRNDFGFYFWILVDQWCPRFSKVFINSPRRCSIMIYHAIYQWDLDFLLSPWLWFVVNYCTSMTKTVCFFRDTVLFVISWVVMCWIPSLSIDNDTWLDSLSWLIKWWYQRGWVSWRRNP